MQDLKQWYLKVKIKVEPYWNVKVGYTFHDEVSERIKVEPYWNVKKKQVGTLIL